MRSGSALGVRRRSLGIHRLLTGSGIMLDDPKVLWGFAFTSSRPLTLEEARPMALQLADAIWNYAQSTPFFINSIERQNQDQPNPERKLQPLNRGYFGYKLAFWDAQVNRPLSPYLAQITLAGNKLLYFYADPSTKALQPPIEESLDDARKLTGGL